MEPHLAGTLQKPEDLSGEPPPRLPDGPSGLTLEEGLTGDPQHTQDQDGATDDRRRLPLPPRQLPLLRGQTRGQNWMPRSLEIRHFHEAPEQGETHAERFSTEQQTEEGKAPTAPPQADSAGRRSHCCGHILRGRRGRCGRRRRRRGTRRRRLRRRRRVGTGYGQAPARSTRRLGHQAHARPQEARRMHHLRPRRTPLPAAVGAPHRAGRRTPLRPSK